MAPEESIVFAILLVSSIASDLEVGQALAHPQTTDARWYTRIFFMPRHFSGWVLCDCKGALGGRASSFLIFSITQILMDGFWKHFKGVYFRGHGRSLSFWSLLSRVMCPWLPCNVFRALTLPFGIGPDIWSYLPLAKFRWFCNFCDNLSSNEWMSMKLCSCDALRAWMLPLGFGPDICSYLHLAKFRRFCNFRNNLSSNESVKLCSCNLGHKCSLWFWTRYLQLSALGQF